MAVVEQMDKMTLTGAACINRVNVRPSQMYGRPSAATVTAFGQKPKDVIALVGAIFP